MPISGAVGRGVEGALFLPARAMGASGWAPGEKGLARALLSRLGLARSNNGTVRSAVSAETGRLDWWPRQDNVIAVQGCGQLALSICERRTEKLYSFLSRPHLSLVRGG